MKSINDISVEHQLLDFLNPVSGLKPQVAFIFAVSLLMFLFLSPWIKQQHLAVFILYKNLPLQAYKPKLSKSRHYEHSWKGQLFKRSFIIMSHRASWPTRPPRCLTNTFFLVQPLWLLPSSSTRFVSLFLDCPSPSSFSVVFLSPSDLQDFILML